MLCYNVKQFTHMYLLLLRNKNVVLRFFIEERERGRENKARCLVVDCFVFREKEGET